MASTEKSCKSIVYGILESGMSDSGKNIVFVEKLVADRLANIQRAIRRAKTWGEFKDLVWAKTYEEILDHQIKNEQLKK